MQSLRRKSECGHISSQLYGLACYSVQINALVSMNYIQCIETKRQKGKFQAGSKILFRRWMGKSVG